jgi:hypothetical protein
MDWKRKLGSRKFWSFVAGFVSSLLIAFNFTESEIVQVTAVITSFGSIAVYMFTEASIDKEVIKKDE